MNIREILLDTETTGLSPNDGHRIVEIGALEMVNKVLTGKKFHFYINPERNMPNEAYRIHGISQDFLQDKPLFKEIADEFMEFIEGGKLVIHNAPFDIKFLNHELSLVKLPSLELSEAIDTLTIARKTFPGARVNLDALCRRFKVDNSSREFHGALLDAALLAEVYVELTGGRQTSFLMRGKSSDKSLNQNLAIKAEGNKIVISPTEEELSRHEEFIEKFIKK
jgi:DNA polymerase-3 subunit epsilon